MHYHVNERLKLTSRISLSDVNITQKVIKLSFMMAIQFNFILRSNRKLIQRVRLALTKL